MAATDVQAASGSDIVHDSTSIAPSSVDGLQGTPSTEHKSINDDQRVLKPGDFKRAKSHLNLRCKTASRVFAPQPINCPASSSSTPDVTTTLSSIASTLPPDFDFVVQAQPQELAEREGRNRDTFGSCQDDVVNDNSDADDADLHLTELNDELHGFADDESVSGYVLTNTRAMELRPGASVAAVATPSLSSASVLDAHASQLKQEAEHAWASYRPGLSPQLRSLPLHKHNDRKSRPSASVQPPRIPRRVTSLHRSPSSASNASPVLGSTSSGTSSAFSSPSQASAALFSPASSSSHAQSDAQGRPRLSAGPRSPEVGVSRPYTASILSYTSESSFPSLQHSFESGMIPLLNPSASSRRPFGRLQRPMTSGSIPTFRTGTSDVEHLRPHTASVSFAQPDASNLLSAEERRQQVRRTKKLTHMLGEEMLLASDHVNAEPQFARANSSSHRKQHRAQSMSSGMQESTPFVSATISGKTRTFSHKLLHGRNQRVKSWDCAYSDMVQPRNSKPANLNRKAAAILGLPHPYSSSALCRVADEDAIATGEELETLGDLHPHPLIPSGLEEFNEPTPKVAQLAAFSAAALDEGLSPTLPHDGTFKSFEQFGPALVESESRRLAAARDERRRRVAKMSRWLGEAVPAELIHAAADKEQSVMIRSTGARLAPEQMPTEDSRNSAACASSEFGSMLRSLPSSSAGHASMTAQSSLSHEGSVVSKLHSFMSIDSSDEEDDCEVSPVVLARKQRPLAERRSADPSPISVASNLPAGMSAYRTSIDSYEYLLEKDHNRLSELSPIPMGTLNTAVATPTSPLVRPPRSPARLRASPSMASADIHASLNASVNEPRPSAAFLDLSGSESDSTTSEELHDIDIYGSMRRPHDRSLSKLSNFFGSTPSQIVKSQAEHEGGGKALNMVLRSFEEEALEDARLGWSDKSEVSRREVSRRVKGLRRRTAKLFA